MLLRLAWRNIWRQKRRTVLTASAIALTLFLSLVMRAFQEGQYTHNILNNAKMGTGVVQLQNPEYKENNSIDELLLASDEFISDTRQIDTIDYLLPRIESFILAASDERSKGVMLSGINPSLEDAYSNLSERIIKGEYWSADETGLAVGVIVGEGVAQYLGLTVGDEIVFYGQGYRGQMAAGLFEIKGIVHYPIKEMNNQLIYVSLSDAQKLFSTGNQVTSWVIGLSDLSKLPAVIQKLSDAYPEGVSIRDWRDLSPELEQSIVLDRVGGLVMMYLLYIVVGFALFATLLMMTLERLREFSVMLATGMARTQLLRLIAIESSLIGLLGIAVGAVTASPLLFYFYQHPIRLTGEMAQAMLDMGYEPVMPVSLDPALYQEQIVIVAAITMICLVYPMWRVMRLDAVSGLKGGFHAH
ncbi:ABC transporter permease [Vibrio breoganii]|uniref:ABC transporter permease n=1 Tax=Vibrio breoganii TaxID=553239 RepID=UPI000C8572FD|nr:FtsX-like permease family protein [Vibrio breoganii]PMK40905.1 ABC transporter substrate-binding protein [Vibrio breoganii]